MRRLIIFILIFVIFLAFIILNLDNKTDISLGYTTFKEIPVFLSSLFSFVLGMLFAVPLVFPLGRGRKKKSGTEDPSSPSKADKKRRGKKSKTADQDTAVIKYDESSGGAEIKKGNGSYGID